MRYITALNENCATSVLECETAEISVDLTCQFVIMGISHYLERIGENCGEINLKGDLKVEMWRFCGRKSVGDRPFFAQVMFCTHEK